MQQLPQLATEQSSYPITVYLHHNGVPIIPNNDVRWSLCDDEGNIINGRENVEYAGADSTLTINLKGNDLLKQSRKETEHRVFVVTCTYDTDEEVDTPFTEKVGFNVQRIPVDLDGVTDDTPEPYRSVFNVRAYGAVGDGVTDDSAALQLAEDAAHAAGGGTVYFPPGTYLVSPSGLTPSLLIDSNIVLMGAGRNSIIKIKDDAGDFQTIFRQRNLSTEVDNILIRDLCFDLNPSGNTTCDIIAGVSTKAQLALYFGNCDNVIIENCYFDPCCGVNTISLNGGKVSLNTVVRNCFFRFVMGNTTDSSGEYDNSCIYFNGQGHTAIGNRFEADYAERARGAIETHSGPSVISNNYSRGFETLCNIVTQDGSETPELPSNTITVTGNTCMEAAHGILLWSITGKTLRNVTVANNTIYVNNADRAADISNHHGIAFTRGTGLNGGFEHITIQGNTIQFQRENRAGTEEADSGGLLFYSNGPMRYLNIIGNTVINAPTQGMRVHATGSSGEAVEYSKFANNHFIDCGNNTLATTGYRAAVLLAGLFTQVEFDGNTVHDSGGASRLGIYGLLANQNTGSTLFIKPSNFWGYNLSYIPPSPNSTGIGTQQSISFTVSASIVTPVASINDLFEYILGASTPSFSITQTLGIWGQRIRIRIKNASGGAGAAITWDSTLKMAAWTNPPNGYNRTIEFVKDNGINWYEAYRSGDIPN